MDPSPKIYVRPKQSPSNPPSPSLGRPQLKVGNAKGYSASGLYTTASVPNPTCSPPVSRPSTRASSVVSDASSSTSVKSKFVRTNEVKMRTLKLASSQNRYNLPVSSPVVEESPVLRHRPSAITPVAPPPLEESPILRHTPSSELRASSPLATPPIGTPTMPTPPMSDVSFPSPPKPRVKSANVESDADIRKFQAQAARSDRKVMDLEISNTSLMAVNKYLEKRLRKQAREISLLKENYKHGIPIESMKELDIDTDDNEEDFDDPDDKDDEEIDDNPQLYELLKGDEEFNPEVLDRKADIIRDRTNTHIQFLENSEKINNSLRKCLILSETLLSDAEKCLAYEVDPASIKIGGKIAHEDTLTVADEETDIGDSLLEDSNLLDDLDDASSVDTQ